MSIIDDEKFNILSQDLLVYITHLEEAFISIEDSEEKIIIQEWLFMILEHLHNDVDEARIRNMALSQMLMDIENNKLRTPFNERPSCRSYAELVEWLKTALDQNATLEDGDDDEIEDVQEPENREMDVAEFDNLMSADNRTYVAIRTLPNGGGIFGYIAISMGDGKDTQWLDCKGKPMSTPVPYNLRVEQIKSDVQQESMLEETDAKQVWDVLRSRKSICLRNEFYDFYKTLYEDVQQEMVAEADTCVIRKCSHPFINKLLEYLVVDLKAIGVSDLQIFNKIKLLSILKKQIKSVICQIEKRTDNLETAMKVSTISPMDLLSTKCCYSFISSTLWNELHQQRPGTKYIDILSYQYPQYFLPKYFSVLIQQKKKILNNISRKYCKILDEMFEDLGASIMSNMMKYKDAHWEWHLAQEIVDAYNKEKAFKDSLCSVESSVDESTESFLAILLNEIDMSLQKLKATEKKNNLLVEQLSKMRNEILDKERIYTRVLMEFEEQIGKLKKQINVEKRDIVIRDNTIAELQRKRKELLKKA
ncbi:uncharacterized protein LOC132924898 [Rhopalosiphum padi]|uniref:uncharacterized protein LOC132924898 n=1 Tax=Rhopalosiphum padi TaxID=40932 RepID=UPI00298DEF62|nr:uncharacterized protein LOC132924898 [Rhopalosiphum padi]